jgi:hypothetical protein
MLRFTKIALLTLVAFLFCGLTTSVLAGPPTSPGAGGASLKLSDFDTENSDCSANNSGCSDHDSVSQTYPAWIHTVSLTAYLFDTAAVGYCTFSAGLYDIDGGDGTGNYATLAEVVATSASPANYFIALPKPIMIDPGDQVFVKGWASESGEWCRGDGHFGYRLGTDD